MTKINLPAALRLSQAKENRSAIITKMKELNELAGSEQRSFTDDEKQKYEGFDQEVRDLGELIKREERQLELDKLAAVPHIPTSNPKESRDLAKYSMTRAIRMSMGDEKRDGIEAEMHEEAKREAKMLGKDINGIGVPQIILSRDFSVTGDSGTKGSEFVATEKKGFIDALLDNLVLSELGATRLTGLTSNISIPKGGAFSAAFKAETDAADNSDNVITDIDVIPHRLPALSKISSQLLMQSNYGVEQYVRNGLMAAIQQALQYAAINGSGTAPNPTGILNTTGIGTVDLGTNGAALTRKSLVDLKKVVNIANALKGNLNYLSNSEVQAALENLKVDDGSGKFVYEDGSVIGMPFITSNTVPNDLTKGTGTDLSAVIFGNWADLLIAQFGGLDIISDKFTLAEEGKVKVVINSFWDTVVTRPESFAAIVDAIA